MSEIIKKYKVLQQLKEEFLNEIKLLYVFKDYNENNALIVTNDDKVFAFGSNSYGVLGFGHWSQIKEITINEELSHKQIVDFKKSFYHVIARTIHGKVYCWGCNWFAVLGNGNNDRLIYKPQLNQYLSDKQIIDICCGFSHSLALTDSGEVYAWGYNKFGQIGNRRKGHNEWFNECQSIPIKVNGFNDEKVIQISCGLCHSMALTESGRVFSWGNNRFGQLGRNKTKDSNIALIILLSHQIFIKKISCGQSHSLLLSSDAYIYWFGSNGSQTQITPNKLKINTNKFIDIESHFHYNISTALSTNGIYYIWGKCGEEVIKDPQKTEFKSFDHIFEKYFGITHKTIHRLDESLRTLDFSLKDTKYENNFEENGSSFGNISKAIDKNSRKTFAIKKILLSEEQKKSICEESKNILKLNDKFVVQCFDIWIEKTTNTSFVLYIQLESYYCSLSEAIDKLNKEFNSKTSLRYYISSELFIELLECVQYLHKQNPPLIHCSIDAKNTQNIKITSNYFGRLVKFGDFDFLNNFFDVITHENTFVEKSDIKNLGKIAEQLFNIDNNR
jgi:alpha-tubulin suppressor-like RCC1 family protein